jgi:hypothetical protein
MKKAFLLLSPKTTVYRGRRILLPETIKNLNIPKCTTCKHFIPDSLVSSSFSKCKKFGKANLVSGELFYDFADHCRDAESKCGPNGAHYVFDEYHKVKKELIKIKPFVSISVFLAMIFSSGILIARSKSISNN